MIKDMQHNKFIIKQELFEKINYLYYIQTDHLGTPRVILDKNNSLVWKWNYSEPFGNNSPEEIGLEFNLRFPGQYWDSEKSSSYNINRDYNPLSGRYLQSDPIGLNAGINTYLYANGNPLKFIDNYGLDTIDLGLVTESSKVGFFFESLIKRTFDFNSDQLTILSHGNHLSMNLNSPQKLASQIINGKFNTNNGIVYNTYYQNQIRQNKPIIIKLDSCNTGTTIFNIDSKEKKVIEYSFAQNLLNYLKQQSPNHDIQIIAPSGYASWIFGKDIISEYYQGQHTQKPSWITFK